MRKFITIAIIALTAAFGAGAADAQVRIKVFANPGVARPKIPRVMVMPKIVKLPPSVAIRTAMKFMPGAKALGVKLRGQTYIVRLKSGGTIAQIGVNSVTGAASRLP